MQSLEFVDVKDTLGNYDGGAVVAYWCIGLDYVCFKLIGTKIYDQNYEKAYIYEAFILDILKVVC